jgi:hypothetical protein
METIIRELDATEKLAEDILNKLTPQLTKVGRHQILGLSDNIKCRICEINATLKRVSEELDKF